MQLVIPSFRSRNSLFQLTKPLNSHNFAENREERLNGPTPTAASLGLNQSVELSMSTPPPKPQDNDNGELDLTGIDDGEIDKVSCSCKP